MIHRKTFRKIEMYKCKNSKLVFKYLTICLTLLFESLVINGINHSWFLTYQFNYLNLNKDHLIMVIKFDCKCNWNHIINNIKLQVQCEIKYELIYV